MKAHLLLVALGIGLPLAGMAQIYRWTDATGQVHYSQTPPNGGQYERVHPADSSGLNPGLNKFVGDTDKANAEADKAQQAEVKKKAESAEACAKARERVSTMEEKGPHRMFISGASSTAAPARMTDEEFNKRLADAQKEVSDNCH